MRVVWWRFWGGRLLRGEGYNLSTRRYVGIWGSLASLVIWHLGIVMRERREEDCNDNDDIDTYS